MQENTTQEVKEQLFTELENQNTNNSHLLESEEVGYTGLKITGNKTTGYYITIGKYVLTEHPTMDKSLLEQMIEERNWNLIKTLIATIAEHIINAELEKRNENYIETLLKEEQALRK